VGIGVLVGLALAAGVTRLLSTLLFGLAPTDAATFIQVVAIVGAASVVACMMPTNRAGRLVVSVLKAE